MLNILIINLLLSQTGELITTIDQLPDNPVVVTVERTNGLYFNKYWIIEPPYELDLLGQIPTDNQDSGLDDVFLKNIDIQNDIGGCLPRDLCFLPITQKYYAYGGKKIIVIDAVTKKKEAEIEVSNTGELFAKEFETDIPLHHENNIDLMDYDIVFNHSPILLYDNKMNRYFTINYSLSKISVIQASNDILPLQSGWNWLSFPRLERYENEYAPSVPELERLNCFPSPFNMHYKDPNIYDNYINHFLSGSGWQWEGGLDVVQSTKGYKLNIETAIETVELPLQGAKLDPETPFILYPDQENWTGYYIDYPQKPWDCFDEDDWAHLTEIKTQYWAMIRIESDPPWYIKGEVIPFEYGDLVILRTDQDDPFTMSWISSGEVAEPEDVPKPEYYTYEEQADYLPVYVEFDETSDVQEVAVMAEGEVRGAAVRESGDTLVQVNAYLEGTTPGAPLEFETWNGLKSAPVERSSYVVYNPRTKKKEKRAVYTGEAARFQWISLKQGEVYEVPDAISDVSCLPNPFSDKINITFRLNEAAQLWVDIFDINGKKIITLLQGELPGGYYNVSWYGDNESHGKVEKGVYFYNIMTNNGTVFSDKIVLIK